MTKHTAKHTAGHTKVERITGAAVLPTAWGEFSAVAYADNSGREHLFVRTVGFNAAAVPLIRLHSECVTGDVFSSLRCDCGDQLHAALQAIAADGNGAVLYLRQEGRGIGLANKIEAYRLQDGGLDTVEANEQLGFAADWRNYSIAADILKKEGAMRVRLMTNNPEKSRQLDDCGIVIAERIPVLVPATAHRRRYLRTKAEKLGHLLPLSHQD